MIIAHSHRILGAPPPFVPCAKFMDLLSVRMRLIWLNESTKSFISIGKLNPPNELKLFVLADIKNVNKSEATGWINSADNFNVCWSILPRD